MARVFKRKAWKEQETRWIRETAGSVNSVEKSVTQEEFEEIHMYLSLEEAQVLGALIDEARMGDLRYQNGSSYQYRNIENTFKELWKVIDTDKLPSKKYM